MKAWEIVLRLAMAAAVIAGDPTIHLPGIAVAVALLGWQFVAVRRQEST